MALLELKFSKPDSSSNWGFRLVGGSDFDQPLVVVKVNEDSLAQQSGLRVGDVIVRINDIPTARLTHTESHELITSAGREFVLGVCRGDSPINIIYDEDYNFEFEEIVRGVQQSVDEDIICQATNIVEKLNKENSRRNQASTSNSGNINSREKMVFSNSAQTDFAHEENDKGKKWSTFLVKPDKSVPPPKRRVDETKLEQDSYKVVIKKGSRRKSLNKDRKVQFDQNITEVESEKLSEETVDNKAVDDIDNENEQAMGSNEEENISEGGDNNDEGDEIHAEKYESEDNFQTNSEVIVEMKYKPLSEIKVDESSESSMTLEEQLLAVQKQLQALSQLPSAIQLTLDAVSKQLASIVSAKESSQEREAQTAEAEEDKGSISEEADAEAEVTQVDDGDTNSNIDEELDDDDSISEEEIKAILERARIEEGGDDEECEQEQDVEEVMTEEQKEIIIKQQEEDAKREKAMDEPPSRPKPIYRPIILPGGRKWSNPEDAIPSFRKPKMSEEKIIRSIEDNLEPIIGNRKGINFLKYQPPPKNLDYLQRSEVYRLVHDMEPPVRGIVSRPEKVIPEQDYYEANKGAP